MVLGIPSRALLTLGLLTLGALSEDTQPDAEPPKQQTQEAQESQEGQQPQEKDWEKYVPSEYRHFADKQQQAQQQAQQKQASQQGTGESKQPADAPSAEKPAAVLVAHPLVLTEGDDTSNSDSRLMEREASLRAVSEAASKESEASTRAHEAIEHLRYVTVEQVMAESHQEWTSLRDLVAYSKEKGADSWEETLEKRTQLLEDFVNKPRHNVLDFNASQAVQLVNQVNEASAEVAENSRKQDARVKSAIQKAKSAAVQKVKSMQVEARSYAHQWKALGKQTVRAQKIAGMGEGVYERHEDEMSDAAGEVGNKAEYFAERLEDKVRDAFSNMEDQVHDLSDDQRSKELQRRASQTINQLHRVADRLGAAAAYEEAESSARFRAEEQRWNSLQSPKAQALAANAPEAAAQSSPDSNLVGAASFALVSLLLLVVLRHRPMTQPLDIQTPPLLG